MTTAIEACRGRCRVGRERGAAIERPLRRRVVEAQHRHGERDALRKGEIDRRDRFVRERGDLRERRAPRSVPAGLGTERRGELMRTDGDDRRGECFGARPEVHRHRLVIGAHRARGGAHAQRTCMPLDESRRGLRKAGGEVDRGDEELAVARGSGEGRAQHIGEELRGCRARRRVERRQAQRRPDRGEGAARRSGKALGDRLSARTAESCASEPPIVAREGRCARRHRGPERTQCRPRDAMARGAPGRERDGARRDRAERPERQRQSPEQRGDAVGAVDEREELSCPIVRADQQMLSVVERERAEGDAPRTATERLRLLEQRNGNACGGQRDRCRASRPAAADDGDTCRVRGSARGVRHGVPYSTRSRACAMASARCGGRAPDNRRSRSRRGACGRWKP